MIRRALYVVALVAGCAGCTPHQLDLWVAWHADDPSAAVAYANRPEVQDQLQAGTGAATEQGSVWDDLAWCESGGDWGYNGGSGYDGGLQFHPDTWRAYGGEEFASHAYNASRAQQIVVAERVLADVGWGAWPACSRKLGLR